MYQTESKQSTTGLTPLNRPGRLTTVEIEEHVSRLDEIVPISHPTDGGMQPLHDARFIGWRMGLSYSEIAEVERVRRTVQRVRRELSMAGPGLRCFARRESGVIWTTWPLGSV